MPREAAPTLQSPDAYLHALRERQNDLREKFKEDPIGLAKRFHLMLPRKPLQVMQELGVYDEEKHGPITPGIRDLVEDTCLGRVRSAAVVGPRGGGKSMGVSFIEFFLWMLKSYDALNLGGSELQADQVYQYLLGFIESEGFWRGMLKGDPLQHKTETLENAWIRVLTASQKSVRSPHAGGRKKDGRMAGGLLVIDEEAEAAPDIVEAALPTVNTARPSVVLRSSTFHNNEGTFADLIDNHAEMGFKLYNWDIFDVCEKCSCVEVCQSEEPCFREDHWEDYTDPETGQMTRRLVHKAYCGGRARYADGWIPHEEIRALWRRMKRNHSRWEVEAMGSRPSTSGHVIKDLIAFARNQTKKTGMELYVPGNPITICVDWGTVAAGVTVWQEQIGDKHKLIIADELREAGQGQILGTVIGYYRQFERDVQEIAADIGGGGNYLNPKLRDEEGLPVRDVNFLEEKEAAVAAWNIYNEADRIEYPVEFDTFTQQVRNWRRKHGRIQKGGDHLCDSSICYFAKFIDRLGISRFRAVPRSFSTATPAARAAPTPGEPRHVLSRPIVRTLAKRRGTDSNTRTRSRKG